MINNNNNNSYALGAAKGFGELCSLKKKCEKLVEDNINEKEYNELERNIYENNLSSFNLQKIEDG